MTGGHAFALVGYNADGFIVQNSWGDRWGLKGFAIVSYEDWVANGRDAWVCVMGAQTRTRSPDYFVSKRSNREANMAPAMRAQLLPFFGRDTEHEYRNAEVKTWGKDKAYRHTIVMGNDGKVINRIVDRNTGADAVEEVRI